MIRQLWLLVLGAFVLGLDAFVLAGLLPDMAQDFGTTQALVGLGVALFTAAYAVSAPALASFAGKYSTRKALLAGLGLFTLGNVATMLAPSLGVLLIARLVAGVGAGLYSPLASSSAANSVEASQRGRALSMVLAGLSTGTALGVPVGLLIASQFGWRWTIGLIVLLGLIAAAGIAGNTRRFPASRPIAWKKRLASLRESFTLATLGVTLWTAIASLGLYTYLAEVSAARGMETSINVFIWLWGLGGMSGALLIGRVIDLYLPPAKATLVLLTFLVIGFVLVCYGSQIFVGMGCLLWGLAGWASIAPQQHALVTNNDTLASSSIAWNSSINYLGSAIGTTFGAVALSVHISASWLPIGAVAAVIVAAGIHFIKIRQR